MRAEKLAISNQYVAWLNASPYFIVVDYRGLRVGHFNELRKRLAKIDAEMHVVKNSVFRAAAATAGVGDLSASLAGQLAMITGRKDVAQAAKILKTFKSEFEKPKIQFGYLNQQRMAAAELALLADLPPLEELRGKLLGLILAPASRLVRLIATPGQQLARTLQARVDQGEKQITFSLPALASGEGESTKTK